MPYPDLLAKGLTTDAPYVPYDLWAGESDIVTSHGTAMTDIPQFAVLARAHQPGSPVILWDGADTKQIIGVAAQAAVANGPLPFYVGGFFNHEMLVWPLVGGQEMALSDKMAAFDYTTCKVGTLV